MKKILILTLLLFMLNPCVHAKSLKKCIRSTISNSHIPQETVAISIKDLNTGKTVYESNEKMLMPPASVQKILTIIPITEALGNDYNFKTELYSRGNSDYLIKLGADPYLTSGELESLIKNINRQNVQKIYIDNSIIESKDWGEGWQWDDDLNPDIRRFNSYNLDKNLVKITVMPTDTNKQAFIINPQKSPIIFFNSVLTGEKNDITISRDNITSSNTLKLEGTVNTPQIYYIPNNNLQAYFEKKLTDTLENERIYLKSSYSKSNQKESDIKLAEISHPISDAIDDVLVNSNNMVIETMAKLAGNKQYNKQGTGLDGIKLFNDYCEKIGIDSSVIRIVDSSGVSKNNMSNADFISEFLLKNKDKEVIQHMASPTQGTLSNRLIPLKDNLKAKTGTLSGISTIAGYLTTKNNHKYVFCIMINDPKSKSSQKKNLENSIIKDMYINL